MYTTTTFYTVLNHLSMVVCVADSARKQFSLVKTTTKDNVEQNPGEFIKCGTVILKRVRVCLIASALS